MKSNGMQQLEDSIIRQAESSGIEIGTDEFYKFVYDRIIRPEVKTQTAVDGKRAKPIRTDVYIPMIEGRLLRLRFLISLSKWCKRNAGMTRRDAADILQLDERNLGEMGEECFEAFGFDPIKLLDGSDRTHLHSHHPEHMTDGCRGSI
jgi:hypothetical protein